uniref:Uncharacterized protein n=1 Tax=Oryza nivara TaxID=4536 RepID=A0A0E0IUA8_ORYNI
MVVELSPHRVSPSPRRRRRLARCCPRGGGDVGELVPAAEAPIDGRSCRIRGVWTLEIAVVAGELLVQMPRKTASCKSSRTGSLCSPSWPCMTPTILAALSAACVKLAGKAFPEKKLSRLSFSHSLVIKPRMCSSASLAASPGFSLSSLFSLKSARASSSIAVHLVGKVCR